MFGCTFSFARTGGGIFPFLLFQTVVSVGMFSVLYSQSMMITTDTKGNYKNNNTVLLLIGVLHSNPHSLRNAALAFLMLAIANITGMLKLSCFFGDHHLTSA